MQFKFKFRMKFVLITVISLMSDHSPLAVQRLTQRRSVVVRQDKRTDRLTD